MKTSELLNETAYRKREGRVLYSGPTEEHALDSKKFDDGYKKVIDALRLKDIFTNAALHVSTYNATVNNMRQSCVKLGIPDGMDASEAEFFIKMAVKVFTTRVAKPYSVEVRDKHRAFYHSVSDYLSAIGRRRKPGTNGDNLELNFLFTP